MSGSTQHQDLKQLQSQRTSLRWIFKGCWPQESPHYHWLNYPLKSATAQAKHAQRFEINTSHIHLVRENKSSHLQMGRQHWIPDQRVWKQQPVCKPNLSKENKHHFQVFFPTSHHFMQSHLIGISGVTTSLETFCWYSRLPLALAKRNKDIGNIIKNLSLLLRVICLNMPLFIWSNIMSHQES